MTTTRATETRTCKRCGAAFTARVVTGVVHCPACREARRVGFGRTARAAVPTCETCFCGKTVVATFEHGVRRPTGVTCPRGCEAHRPH